ncbi:MAG: pyrroline-5-carboxylate reductase [Elusimicrobiota bacterium]|nr:pyrroline-5-carboxylate reductase [Elusimicrobiota bacterium]
MKTDTKKLLFLGCGAMGEAILSSCLQNGLYLPENIFVVDTDQRTASRIALSYGVKTVTPENSGALKDNFSAVIAAVKPQSAESIIPTLENLRFQMLITILAGVKCSYFTNKIEKLPVLRVMPNICIQVSNSVSALFANENLNSSPLKKELTETAEKIFSASGRIIWAKTEDYIDKATAISGSGPAYAAYFTEALKEAAVSLGFKPDEAELLSTGSFDGAMTYMKKTGQSAETLRKKVTSPGGTTEKAINVFENNKLKETISKACLAAYERAGELGKKQ